MMSQRNQTERGVNGRTFSRATRAEALAQRGPTVSESTANRIMHCADRAKARATAYHGKHRQVWANKAYGDLLQKHGLERAPKPDWAASNPQARLMAQADQQVSSKLASRLDRIDRARSSMMRSGIVRENRKVDWKRGLGE